MDRPNPPQQLEEMTERKERKALEGLANAGGYRTIEDHSGDFPLVRLTTPFIRKIFGGPFYRSRAPREPDLPVVTVVFVQDRDGNALTASGNPGDLEGGPTDLHAVYEGLSRVDADAVATGAKTAAAAPGIFSVWHPEWVSLRRSRGQGRHPAQVVVTPEGNVDLEKGLLFNLPDVTVYLLLSPKGLKRLNRPLAERPWLIPVETGEALDWRKALRTLKTRGVHVVSLVGGPTTATGAVDQGVVTDLYLTTSPSVKGLPGTPWYRGKQCPPLGLIVRKEGQGTEQGILFEHFGLTPPSFRQ